MCPFTFLLQYLVYLFFFFLLFSEKKFNFKKYLSKAIDSLGTKHGFKSIMHYGSKVFSKKKPTIVAKKEGVSSIKMLFISGEDRCNTGGTL